MHADAWSRGGREVGDKPFFSVRLSDGQPRTDGVAHCRLGRRIPVEGQELDEGVFVEWSWDGRRLTIENDRYGQYPLFYCAQPDSICISPALARVVRENSQRRFDKAALGVFFRMGHFVGEDTPFEDVRFLPPNSVLTWENGRLDIQVRPFRSTPPASAGGSFDDAVEAYETLFARAIARRLPDHPDFVVPISGGRDSRHILLELARQGAIPKQCVTVKYRPPATNEDTRIARLMAERLGIEHIEIDKPASFFHAELNDVRLTNYCGGGHGWAQPVAAALNGRYRIAYDGLAGSVLSGGFMLAARKMELFRDGRFDELARLILQENHNEGTLRHVFSEDFYRTLALDAAVERLVPELRRHADTPNPVLSFVFWNRTRRCVASIPFAVMHGVPVVHVPYLDHELFDFLFALDASMVENNRLHDATIRRAYPEFADVPYEDKKARAVFRPDEHHYYRDARKDLFAYLRTVPREARAQVRASYVYAKIGFDLVGGKKESPWYMRPALQRIELEKLRLGLDASDA